MRWIIAGGIVWVDVLASSFCLFCARAVGLAPFAPRGRSFDRAALRRLIRHLRQLARDAADKNLISTLPGSEPSVEDGEEPSGPVRPAPAERRVRSARQRERKRQSRERNEPHRSRARFIKRPGIVGATLSIRTVWQGSERMLTGTNP